MVFSHNLDSAILFFIYFSYKTLHQAVFLYTVMQLSDVKTQCQKQQFFVYRIVSSAKNPFITVIFFYLTEGAFYPYCAGFITDS